MRKLILVLLWVGLSGCMKVSDMADGVGFQFRDAGVLDHSRTYRVNNWHLQPDSFIYIAQGAFAAWRRRRHNVRPADDAALAQPASVGRMGSMRYFFHYELPKIGAWLQVVSTRDATCASFPEDAF